MTPSAATIDQILSSARVGAAVTCVALALLVLAQLLHWRQPAGSLAGRRGVVSLAALSCLVAIVLITARFLIIN